VHGAVRDALDHLRVLDIELNSATDNPLSSRGGSVRRRARDRGGLVIRRQLPRRADRPRARLAKLALSELGSISERRRRSCWMPGSTAAAGLLSPIRVATAA
jgi:histidine ammonia-lyase